MGLITCGFLPSLECSTVIVVYEHGKPSVRGTDLGGFVRPCCGGLTSILWGLEKLLWCAGMGLKGL